MTAEVGVSVVIPAYNEEQRLPRHLPDVASYFERRGESHEILVVDDGSADGTARVVREMARAHRAVRLLSLPHNLGKGGAVKAGMAAAVGRRVLFSDADQSAPIEEAGKLLERLDGGYDLAIGSRRAPGAQVERSKAWPRTAASRAFGLGTRLLCIRGIWDTQCGLKAMTREVARKVFPRVTSNSVIFDVEMLIVATREGYRVAEVPVRWRDDPETRIPYDARAAVTIWRELFRVRRAQGVWMPLRVRS